MVVHATYSWFISIDQMTCLVFISENCEGCAGQLHKSKIILKGS